MSMIEDRIIRMIQDRADVGLKKYGVDMTREDLTELEWCQHHLEELLDAAVYVMKRMTILEEKRMNVIGQNGPSGEHYNK